MLKKLFNWLFNVKEKQSKQAYEEFIRIEFRKPPKRGQ